MRLGSESSRVSPARRESGVALILVLAVLTALLTMALPFSWSMKTHREAAEVSLNRSKVEADLSAARLLTQAALAQSQADRDTTPFFDDDLEIDLDLNQLKSEYLDQAPLPGDLGDGKIWSATATDSSGLVHLQSASMFLLGNLFDLTARVAVEIPAEPETSEIRLSGAESFPPKGILWVGGELIGYEQFENGRFSGLIRGMTTSVVSETLGPRKHASGTLVVDYRIWLLAHYPYEWSPGEITDFNTIDEIRQIVRLGEFGFTYDELDAIREFLTLDAPWPTSRFTNPQNLISTTEAGRTASVRVSDARHITHGSMVRFRGWDGAFDYRIALGARQVGPGQWNLFLDRPLSERYQADQAVVETLVRHPGESQHRAQASARSAFVLDRVRGNF